MDGGGSAELINTERECESSSQPEWLGTGNTRHTRSERIKRIKRTKRAGWGPTVVKRAAPTSMVGMKAHEELTN